VRLRKYVTTENVTQTVPVQREEVRKEHIETDGDNNTRR
jgi:stress response protein YsnF